IADQALSDDACLAVEFNSSSNNYIFILKTIAQNVKRGSMDAYFGCAEAELVEAQYKSRYLLVGFHPPLILVSILSKNVAGVFTRH
ncbi:hypothetical protein, partial [Crocosphaera sp. XPORK-15E]|uniref:hypothetical protein n=1 Tax=Crocosphaera sp. XPORK-15E TaxID=3110247 RepID=UPI002B202D80